jgi:hypothetical protein
MEGDMHKKQYFLIVLLGLAAGLVGGIVSTQLINKYWHAKAIKAEAFTILDEKGREKGFFKTTAEGLPVLQLSDKHGHTVIFLSVADDGSGGVSFWAEEGQTITSQWGISEKGIPSLDFSNPDPKDGSLVLNFRENGLPRLYFVHKNFSRDLMLNVDGNQPYLCLFDTVAKDSKPLWSTPLISPSNTKSK